MPIARLLTRVAFTCVMAIFSVNCADAETAAWLFRTDLECRWSIDGESKGVLHLDDRARVTLELGEHLVEAVPTSGGQRWEKVINVQEPKSEVFTIPLLEFERIELRNEEQAETRKRGYWIDRDSKLMWAAKESGIVNWNEAAKHCQQITAGGFRDWRLPSIDELERLRDPGWGAPKGGIYLTGLAWSATQGIKRGEAWKFDFRGGDRKSRSVTDNGMTPGLLHGEIMASFALCVRPAP